MKYLILLSLFVTLAHAGECKLTGITRSCEKLETKFEMSDMNACETLAKQTKTNKFFNFIEADDRLVKTMISFKNDSEVRKDQIEFIDAEECI